MSTIPQRKIDARHRRRRTPDCTEAKAQTVMVRPNPAPSTTDLEAWARAARETQ